MTIPRTTQAMLQHGMTNLTNIVLMFVQGATLFQ